MFFLILFKLSFLPGTSRVLFAGLLDARPSLLASLSPRSNPVGLVLMWFSFADEANEAQRGEATCPGSHSQQQQSCTVQTQVI